ncbi:acetylornithine/succinylornithine family transaminase [Campylobacter upsaliensis]|uniref:Acetylornithine aminotransferase n=1 Tax=Campylobacter upsaliensis JV21 TaxID=888826 RepID=A0A828QTJ5_CAMUP|nr:acetylornithine/succinylornithine family transaminase [Campylobacter upsaliensis]EAB5281610.1 acetylornithine/succinylornithine family transaminase [Campylobacter upsaliensis]EAH5880087.1 acetylornithine/succinylornithine family transaminase [Campylobacter upsaliensis]EAH5903703.1 acetylornithine/succinylornithine family transaminase [Campylobacter upsaliensis]EAH6863062.1 acetylornithine/succinylornithine family transaminase [Campylobacter upsaliensis]EAH7071903.1 acetylornithine/succinylo
MLLEIYNKFELTLARGEGVHLYDDEDREFLDFASGIGVCALGYNHKLFNEALKKQIGQILHTSNLYHNKEVQKAARNLAKASKLHRVFFTNSGTESVEGAMKVAKKYAFNKGIKNPSFIAFKNSFHGRTLGALSLTANEKYKKPFKPLISGIKFATFNDLESVKKLLNEKTCAIVLESVQGEGGINPATPEFYKGLRKLCDERDLLLISDEIQCGMGRSGKYFAYEYSQIVPDVAVFAKALGCGVAVGAFGVSERVAQNSLKAGDHGSTYGGNPLACAAVNAVFEIYAKEKILSRVAKLTPYLEKALDELTSEFDFCEERRGLGFMQGLRLNAKIKVADVLKKCRENRLLLLSCSKNDLRFLPPLIIEKEHIDVMAEKLRAVLRGF